MTRPAAGARRHLALDEVGSTNAVALEAARAGDPGRLWITAGRQTAGRGRRGRSWLSERGNLYATLLLVDPAPDRHVVDLPLVVALGVRNGLAELSGLEPGLVRIKWPNDILIAGAKAVGILLESEKGRDGRRAVAIGCGVNVESGATETPYAVTSLREAGYTGTLATVFDHLAAGVDEALELWDAGRQFERVRSEWLRHSVGRGEGCRVNLPDGTSVEGTFVDLDQDGRLVLDEGRGQRRHFSAGDLFFLRGSTGA
ncbi:biotin--[acetyl-CoA-carboxylase] ligase [Aureimonas flava]|uniref:biotin--[biotin carboxyl-carrier protein] ligase n=1 Tax=Aureimonas flava TaxID=2320271 RepID=A0A3A1WRJ5_9HYPH|nr:biotin--[acetyl-CoA-carboxylase] ligase [Aureimonas flava]RIY03693.1 biotin--[acetyl-CoA-carboxylase] ligase [Aureimonas flava]